MVVLAISLFVAGALISSAAGRSPVPPVPDPVQVLIDEATQSLGDATAMLVGAATTLDGAVATNSNTDTSQTAAGETLDQTEQDLATAGTTAQQSIADATQSLDSLAGVADAIESTNSSVSETADLARSPNAESLINGLTGSLASDAKPIQAGADRKLADLRQALDDVAVILAQLTSPETTFDDLQSRLMTLQLDISTLQGTPDTIEGRISEITTALSSGTLIGAEARALLNEAEALLAEAGTLLADYGAALNNGETLGSEPDSLAATIDGLSTQGSDVLQDATDALAIDPGILETADKFFQLALIEKIKVGPVKALDRALKDTLPDGIVQLSNVAERCWRRVDCRRDRRACEGHREGAAREYP